MVTSQQAKEALKIPATLWKVAQNLEFFLDYVYILERPNPRLGIAGGRQKFQKWPHIMEMLRHRSNRKKIRVKARQVGASWFEAAECAWLFRFHSGSLCGMFSRGQAEAQSLMSKVRFIDQNLPEEWNLPALDVDSRTEMAVTVDGITSQILAYPSTRDAGRGESFTKVVMDEADFHEFMDEVFLSVSGSVDSTGGDITLLSTVNKYKQGSVFQEIAGNADNTDWDLQFIGWSERPGRDPKWYDWTKANIPETEKLSPDLFMEQEYPGTLEEALAPARASAAFDLDILKNMEGLCRDPIIKDGPKNYYENWRPGGKYVAGTDTSHGVGMDFSYTCVLELNSGKVVADILENRMPPDEIAYHSMQMLQKYKSPNSSIMPLWGIEDNEWGIEVLNTARAERYNHIFKQSRNKHGWHTDGKSRWTMWTELIRSVNAGQVIIPNKQALSQLFTAVLNSDKGGRPEARQGANDDVPTALAIAYQMRKGGLVMGDGQVVTAPAMF